jgi:hypothetical protein
LTELFLPTAQGLVDRVVSADGTIFGFDWANPDDGARVRYVFPSRSSIDFRYHKSEEQLQIP